MMTQLSRRETLRLAAMGVAGGLIAACAPSQIPVEGLPTTPQPATNDNAASQVPARSVEAGETSDPAILIQGMKQAAAEFLGKLDDSQRAKATYAFDDSERVRWHWTTPSNFPRNGLPLTEMNEDQRLYAFELLRASVSAIGYQKALDIISLQSDLSNDPLLYFVTVFGDPLGDAPWGWRWEGHHLSRNFTIADGKVAVTPFFLGAWPTLADSGLRAMPREEDAARELISSLSDSERQVAIIQERTLTNHVTQNQPRVTPLDPLGIEAGALTSAQQGLILEIINTYLGVLPAATMHPHFERLQNAGLDNVRFGWAGSMEPRNPHYYRLQGPTFLLEFDNSRNRGGHIHSVWRDFAEDFGM